MAENCITDCETCATAEVTIPTPDPADKLNLTDLKVVTTEDVLGTGVFDIYMRAGSNQLDVQYQKGRIKGKEYANAFIQMTELMMTQANAFVIQAYTAQLDAEAKALLFPYTAMALKYDVALKESQARESAIKNKLTCTQMEELVLNGEKDRELKTSQIAVQGSQKLLYDRQKIGFDDKKANDDLKIVMDSWAVQAAEMNEAGTSHINLLDVNGNGTLDGILTSKV